MMGLRSSLIKMAIHNLLIIYLILYMSLGGQVKTTALWCSGWLISSSVKIQFLTGRGGLFTYLYAQMFSRITFNVLLCNTVGVRAKIRLKGT